MMRVRDWSTQLALFLQRRRLAPFEWGTNDCCLFAADAYNVVCGEDLASEFRGRYKTELGAYRALKKAGFNSVEAVLSAKLGEPSQCMIPERGDVVLVDYEGQYTAGVYFNSVWLVGESGLVTAPMSWVVKVWSTK